jgi:hypothetical protein
VRREQDPRLVRSTSGVEEDAPRAQVAVGTCPISFAQNGPVAVPLIAGSE